MAEANSKMIMLFNLVLIISLLLISNSMAEAKLFGLGSGEIVSTPVCQSVYGFQAGDTCFSVTQQFNLSLSFFSSINPNLNCDKIFPGQWLCVEGSV